MDVQKTLEFAEAVCKDARGNISKMNRIGANKALKFYMDNVVMLATVTNDTFATCYPQFMEEIDSIRLQTEKAQEAEQAFVDQGDRIAALEAKLDKLTDALTRFMASTEDEAEPEPAEPPKKRRKKDQDPEDQPDPAETAAEEGAEDEA